MGHGFVRAVVDLALEMKGFWVLGERVPDSEINPTKPGDRYEMCGSRPGSLSSALRAIVFGNR